MESTKTNVRVKSFTMGARISETKSLFVEVKVNPNSTAESTMRTKIAESLAMLTRPHGMFLHWLLLWKKSSNGEKRRMKRAGAYTRTVLWKHEVKSGDSVFHVRSVSHRGVLQKSITEVPSLSKV